MSEVTFKGVIVEPLFLWGDGAESDTPLAWKGDDYIVVNDTTTLREVLDFVGTTLTIEFLEGLQLDLQHCELYAQGVHEYILGNVA